MFALNRYVVLLGYFHVVALIPTEARDQDVSGMFSVPYLSTQG